MASAIPICTTLGFRRGRVDSVRAATEAGFHALVGGFWLFEEEMVFIREKISKKKKRVIEKDE